jgi:hypothetical protein
MRWMALVGAIFLMGCGSPEDKLVGVWESEDSNYRNRLDLHKNGTFDGSLERMVFSSVTTPLGQYTGSWRIESGRLSIVVTTSSIEMLSPGYAFSDPIVEFSDDAFSIRSANGHEERFRRVERSR